MCERGINKQKVRCYFDTSLSKTSSAALNQTEQKLQESALVSPLALSLSLILSLSCQLPVSNVKMFNEGVITKVGNRLEKLVGIRHVEIKS